MLLTFAICPHSQVIEKCFRGTASRIGGVSFRVLAEEGLERHVLAFGERECDSRILRDPGFLHWRSGGEKHINDPTSIALLQEATKHGNSNAYEKYEYHIINVFNRLIQD